MKQHVVLCGNSVYPIMVGSVLHNYYEQLNREEYVKACRNKKKRVRSHEYPWYKQIK